MEGKNESSWSSVLGKTKRVDNFNMALMDEDELIGFLVEEMEKIERNFPDMVLLVPSNNDTLTDDGSNDFSERRR